MSMYEKPKTSSREEGKNVTKTVVVKKDFIGNSRTWKEIKKHMKKENETEGFNPHLVVLWGAGSDRLLARKYAAGTRLVTRFLITGIRRFMS